MNTHRSFEHARAHAAAAVLVCGITLWTSVASADPRTHDGFQFRGAVGGGYVSDAIAEDGVSTDYNIHGSAGVLELYFGGTVVHGLALGGFVSGAAVPGPSASQNGTDLGSNADATLNFWMVGPYVDWYPDPTHGFHLLGQLAAAGGHLKYDSSGDTSGERTGGAIGFGVGYDWWVADEWSIGILGRLSLASLKYSTTVSAPTLGVSADIKETDTVVAPSLLFSVAYQ